MRNTTRTTTVLLLCRCRLTQQQLHSSRSLFTNAERMKKDDPYAQLGLTWGATTTEIKEAYKRKAREHHPDVNPDDPKAAAKKFQAVQQAYQKLTEGVQNDHNDEEWSFAVWRSGDMIAQERTDVAGVAKKRPAKPALQKNASWGVAALGHPSGRGVVLKRGEYLGKQPSSTVGTGRSKWVTPKEFTPWNRDAARKSASRPEGQKGE